MSSERFCIEALREHFPAPAYAVLDHVRSHTGYGGRERTIDAIVMGLWPSRGIELWGIEIKSSRSDWQRELRDPAKAERLFAEFDRFFLLTGDLKVAALDEIPEPWGWMAIGPKGRREGSGLSQGIDDGWPTNITSNMDKPLDIPILLERVNACRVSEADRG